MPLTTDQPESRVDRDEPDESDGTELSERETREVLSALSKRDEPESDGFEGRDDSPTADPSQKDEADDDHLPPPASELARRWRNLRAGTMPQ